MERSYVVAVLFNGLAAIVAAFFSLLALFGHDWTFLSRMPSVTLFTLLLTGVLALPVSAVLISGLRVWGATRWSWPRQVASYVMVWIGAVVIAITAAWLVFRAEAPTWSPSVLLDVVVRTLAMGWGLPVLFGGAMGGWTAYLLHRRSPKAASAAATRVG